MNSKDHFINGQWITGEGPVHEKVNPSNGEVAGSFRGATLEQTSAAVSAARAAFPDWSARSVEDRTEALNRYADTLKSNSELVAEMISLEIGKPPWEAATEVAAMIGKVGISINAFEERCGEFTGGPSVTRFRPHGAVAVLGPFNFPGHLPNGHIVPALLAGNTVVFKPSELSPFTAQRMVELWRESGLPDGVLNLIQGSGETGKDLVEQPDIDGVFFTGSARVGQRLREHFATRPGKILALEMGGNNPLVVEEVDNRQAAVLISIQSAFLTAGQRCTCARRLIVPRGEWGEGYLEALAAAMDQIVVGPPDRDPAPFIGPVVSEHAATEILASQESLLKRGGNAIRQAELLKPGTGLLRPGLIDVTELIDRADEEVFGPLLQVIRVDDFEAAIEEANNTEFGLAAGLISDSRTSWDRFRTEVRAGVMNWNQQTTGASSAAPFGGTGRSGNFRPSAFFAADYCSWPVASIEIESLSVPENLPPGLSLS